MPLTTGQILQQRYRIVALLGQGGMGAVYRAQDARLDISVAIKELLPQPGLDTQLLSRLRDQFLQEARVLARLNHPHLVNVTDFFEEGDKAYLVMQFIEGESLAEHIARQGAISEVQVVGWATQILDALAYCHDQHILHRDIKPQNIVIEPHGDAVLVDFGLVKLWDPADPRTRTTIRGAGTPEYAPPEQYSGQAGHTDPRSDIYSLGATLYHALTGTTPPSVTERMAFPQQFQTPRELNGLVSPQVDGVIQRAMALPQDERWLSAVEMMAALQGFPRTPEVSRRTLPVGVWGIGVVLILGLLMMMGIGSGLIARTGTPSPIIQGTEDPTTEVVALLSEATETATPRLPPTIESSDVVLATATSLPTSTPKLTATPPPTLTPTSTVAPTATPSSIPTPAPTATPSCPAVTGPFAAVWVAEQERLGCAQGNAFSGLVAEETFEKGKMFWREPIDTAQALVLFNDGSWRIFTHAPYVEGSPEFPCVDANTPAQCPPTPKRGFGTMWCNIAEIRSGLGNALDCERGYQGDLQLFQRGSMLRTDTGAIYIFYDDGGWGRR